MLCMCSSITMAKKASLVLTNQPVRLFCVMIDLSSGSQTVMGNKCEWVHREPGVKFNLGSFYILVFFLIVIGCQKF